MMTFLLYSFSFLKISQYINFKKFFGRILAPPSGRRPGAAAPPRYATGQVVSFMKLTIHMFLEDELKYFFLRFYWDVYLFTLVKPIIMGVWFSLRHDFNDQLVIICNDGPQLYV